MSDRILVERRESPCGCVVGRHERPSMHSRKGDYYERDPHALHLIENKSPRCRVSEHANRVAVDEHIFAIAKHLPGRQFLGFSPQELELSPVDEGKGPQKEPPSRAGLFILYLFLAKNQRDVLPGDLHEEYHLIIRPQFGWWRAKVWYWKQVSGSVVPILWARARKLISIAALGEALRRISVFFN